MPWLMKAMKASPSEAEILIYDVIGGEELNAKSFVESLRSLSPVPEVISLRINTPGGSVIDGNVIYNELMAHGAKINVSIDGMASSMGSVIAMAGDRIVMPENAWYFIHNPWTYMAGDSDALKKEAALLDGMKRNAIKAYMRHVKGLTEQDVSDLMDKESWIGSEDALSMGFADEIIAPRDVKEMSFANLKNVPDEVYSRLLGTPSTLSAGHVCRIKDPSRYDRFRKGDRDYNGKTYSAVSGKVKGSDAWEEQAFWYNKDIWEAAEARNHCVNRGGKFEAAKAEVSDGGTNSQLSIKTEPSPSTKGAGMKVRIDEKGNLINAETNEVLKTREQLEQEGVKMGLVTADAHQREMEEARQQAAVDEQNRILSIQTMCVDLGQPGMATDLIKNRTTLEQAQSQVVKSAVSALRTARVPGSAGVSVDERDKMRAGLVNMLACRSGVETDPKKHEELRKDEAIGGLTGIRSLVRFLGVKAGIRGAESADGSAIGYLFKTLLGYNGPVMGMGMNTNDLHSVLATTANYAMLKGYGDEPVTYPRVSRPMPVSDLKLLDMYKNSDSPDVMEIPEGQPALMGKVSDSYEQAKLKKFGRGFSITEEAIINDRTDVFSSLPAKFGRAVQREINDLFWRTLLTGNGPTLLESGDFFHAAGNFQNQGVAAAIAAGSLSTAFALIRRYRRLSPDGGRSRVQRMNIPPRLLVVGVNNEYTGRIYTSNQYTPSTANNVNQLLDNQFSSGRSMALDMVVESLVDDLIATGSWFLALDPNVIDHSVILTLSGRESPKTDSRVGGAGEVKGVIFDIEHFFNVAFVDWRGWYKNVGV